MTDLHTDLLESKSGWKTMKFGDIAENIAIRVDPAEVETDVYVGLEHLDPESLHLREWGHPSDVTGQKLKFKKGDVIFGRRRAYQRKLAIAEFDGICSAHAMVLRAKPEMILPEFLPFFIRSDMFMDRAIKISVGSLSPTVNWKTMRLEEFPLPPIEEQRRIAEILWAADEAMMRYSELEQELEKLFKISAIRTFPKPTDPDSEFVVLSDICLRRPQSGLYKGPDFIGHGVKTVKMGELFGNELIDERVRMDRMDLTLDEIEKYRLTSNDLLFGRRSIVLEGAGKCSMVGDLSEPVVFESSLLRVTIDPNKAISQYVYSWFKSPAGIREIRRIRSFTTVAGITGSDLGKVRVPLFPLARQKNIVHELFNHRTRIDFLAETQEKATKTSKVLSEILVGKAPHV